jgi:hypothetical protein
MMVQSELLQQRWRQADDKVRGSLSALTLPSLLAR